MMASTNIPEWHVLDFFRDDTSSCALTVLVRGFRFHVIADKDNFPVSTSSGKTYNALIKRLESGKRSLISASDEDECETDSGVDVSSNSSRRQKQVDPEEALQRFVLEPLSAEFGKLSRDEDEETVQEWYNGPTYFYDLKIDANDDVEAIQLEATQDLTERMAKLKPEIAIPKYMTDKIVVRHYQASDLTVISTSDQPPGTPYHPCRVRTNDTNRTFFLKIVDHNQPQTVKRELDILYRAMKLELHKKINVPSLEGLVLFNDSELTKSGQKRMMGFLQTDITDAKPLTGMLDPAIEQGKRERWAEEAERTKEVLHEHDIVWGDAKADNFVVDNDDKLWIIDFGGSYTEGWVDPEMKETVEGDDMGTERIVNALEDPVANTYNPDEEDEDERMGEEERNGKVAVEEKSEITFSPDKLMKRKRVEEEEAVEKKAKKD